jgi:chromosome segregation ATPase
LNQSFDFAFGEIEKLNQRLEETERVFSSYKANNEQKINEHLQLFHDMGEQHQQTVDSLKRDLVDKDHLICEKSRQINSLYDEIDSLHKTITELETTYAFVSVADDSLDSLSPEQLKERYQEMVRNNEAERLILNSNLSKLSLFQKRLDAARYDLGFKNDEIAQLKTQFEQQKESLKKEIISQKALEIDLLNKTIIELKLAHRRVEQNLNDNITHLNDELQKEKISARSKEEAKDETITILNEKNYNFQITIKDLKKQVSNLNVQLQNKIEDIKYLRSDRRLALIGSSMQGIVD